jgi:hypothetical protein
LHAYPVKIASTAGKNLALSIPVSMNEPWLPPDWVAAHLWSDPSSQDWCLLAKLGNQFALAFFSEHLSFKEKMGHFQCTSWNQEHGPTYTRENKFAVGI